MANCIFGWPIFSDVNKTYTPTFSGPAWAATGDLAIANLQDRRMSKVARSVDATLANTWFDIDLKRACRVGLLALPASNASLAAKIRMRGFSTLPIFDSLTVGDAAWAVFSGTPTRTAAGFVCSDGIPLDLIGDDDPTATAGEAFSRAMVYTGNGTKAFRFRIRPTTNLADTRVQVIDTTAVVTRLNFQSFMTAGVPAFGIVSGAGTIVSTTLRGDGSYDVVCTIPGVVAANTHSLRVFPASTSSTQGTVYLGAFMAWDNATDQLVYESGLLDAWPIVYPDGSLPIGDPRLVASGGTGKYTAEEVAEIGSIGYVHIPASVQNAQFWRIAAHDTTNAAGYVELGRLMICGAYQPSLNMINGAKLGVTTESTRVVTDGGAGSYNEKPTARSLAFSIENLPENEGLVNLFDLMRRVGITKQFFFVFDPADTYHLHRRSFACVLRELSALEYPWGTATSIPFVVQEDL